MTRPLVWIVVGVLLVINVGIRLPGVRGGVQPPLVRRTYGAGRTGFSLAFPTPLTAADSTALGAVYSGIADDGHLAVGVTVSRLAGSSTSHPVNAHPVCNTAASTVRGSTPGRSTARPASGYCREDLVVVRVGTVFSVTILSSEGAGRAQAVAQSFRA